MSRIQQLSQCLVEKYSLSEQDAAMFVTSLFETIRERLITDKLVKVKGLGTFKLAEMNARESVDVNTGERITIEGRYKLSFTPENAVRDRINSPFASFESIDMDDEIDFSEIDKKYEEGATTVDEPPISTDQKSETEPETEPTPEPVTEPVVTMSPVDEQHEVDAQEEKTVADETPANIAEAAQLETPVEEPADESPAEPVAEEPTESSEVEKQPIEPENIIEQTHKGESSTVVVDSALSEELIREDMDHNKTIITLLRWVLGVVILILICIGAHFGYNVWHDNGMNLSSPQKPTAVKAEAKKVEKPKTVHVSDSIKDTVKVVKAVESTTSISDSIYKISDTYNNKDARVRTGAYNIIGTKEIVTVRKGQTLQSISKALLGESMECYVEVYNDGKTSVQPGDKIKIPKLELKKKRKKK